MTVEQRGESSVATPIVLPDLGAGESTISVSCWLADLGDHLDEGDRVVEVLMKGITFDVAAPVSGMLCRIDKLVDAVVASGDVLGWIDLTSEPVAG